MEIPFTTKPRPDTGLYNAKVGIWLFLASEVMLFGALFSSYIMLRVGAPHGTWPEPGSMLNPVPGAINTAVLIVSSLTVVLAWASLKFGKFNQYKLFQGITILCAGAFMCIKAYEYNDKFHHYEIIKKDGTIVDGHKHEFTDDYVVLSVHTHAHAESHDEHAGHDHEAAAPAHEEHAMPGDESDHDPEGEAHSHEEHAAAGGHEGVELVKVMRSDIKKMENYGPYHSTYLAIYFTMTGLHALHVMGGAFVIFMIWGPLAGMWKTDPERYTNRVEVSGLFWHFVDLVWIFLFPLLYLL